MNTNVPTALHSSLSSQESNPHCQTTSSMGEGESPETSTGYLQKTESSPISESSIQYTCAIHDQESCTGYIILEVDDGSMYMSL